MSEALLNVSDEQAAYSYTNLNPEQESLAVLHPHTSKSSKRAYFLALTGVVIGVIALICVFAAGKSSKSSSSDSLHHEGASNKVVVVHDGNQTHSGFVKVSLAL